MLKDMIARISQTLDFIVIPPQTLFVVGYTVFMLSIRPSVPPSVTLRFLAHLSRRLTRWAYRMGLEPSSVCPCVHTFKHEYLWDQQADYNQILSEASLGWGKGCIRFWCRSDQIRTLVSMATDSSYRVIMGKGVSSRFLGCFWSDPFYTCR